MLHADKLLAIRKKQITVLSDGVHKSDRNFSFSGCIRPRRRCFRLVKATPLVQIVDSGLSGF